MPEMKIDVEIWCSCGEGICRNASIKNQDITLEPCEDCLKKANQEGHDEGFNVGYEEGYEKGKDEATKQTN